MQMTYDEYRGARDAYEGYCTHCDDIGRYSSTEPDARNYPCDECGNNTCFGIEEALFMGKIEIVEE